MNTCVSHILYTSLLLLASCARSDFHFDGAQGFTADESVEVSGLINGVNGVFGSDFFNTSNRGVKVILVHSDRTCLETDTTQCDVGYAHIDNGECHLELADAYVHGPYTTALVYHELGHCMGMVHSTDPNDIMYPVLSIVQPSVEQIQAFKTHALNITGR